MSPSSRIHVLHVDDEEDLVELAAEFLRREDDRFDVATETNPADALELIHAEEFDCVVSDFQMPDMDGLEFLEAVRADYPNLPFILFTGQGSEEIASEALTAGATDYLQKGSGSERYTMLANRITNAVERSAAVRQTDLSFRALETATEGISLVEPDGTFSYLNSAFAELFGYEREELIGTHWTVLYHDEEAQRLENHILPAVVEHGYWAGETVRLRKDGERLITDHRLAHTSEGVIVCTARDVTDERIGTGEPTTAYDLLVDTIGDGAFYALDHEGYVTRWSDEAARLKGYDTDEVLGEHISIFFTDEERAQGLPEQLLETARIEGTVTDEGWRLRRDGSRFWADVTMAASYDDAGTIRGYGKLIRESAGPAIA